MRSPRFLSAILLVAAGFGVVPSFAAGTSLHAAVKACNAGSDPAAKGSTPEKIDGVTVVSPREAKCLMDKLGQQLVVIQAMNDEQFQLPGARLVADAASSSSDPDAQRKVEEQYRKLTGGNKQRPLLVYCHHPSCPYSYHASERAVAAGYKNVFWLREGNEGWGRAGYAYGSGAVDADGMPPRFADAAAACSSRLASYTPMQVAREIAQEGGDVEAWGRALTRKKIERVTECHAQLKKMFASSPAVQAEVDRRQARLEPEVQAFVKRTRASVEADPASYFEPYLDDIGTTPLKDALASVRSIKSVRQACGPFDVAQPSAGDNSALHEARAEVERYARCFDENNKLPDVASFGEWHWKETLERIQGLDRYTCSQWRGRKCVSDASWQRVASILTPANTELIRSSQPRLQAAEQENERIRAEVRQWRQTLRDRVDSYNAAIEQRNSNSGGSYTYTPPAYEPPPPVYSPPRSTIYEGVK